MKAFQVYLNFDGNCREAMTFYQRALGAELEMQSFSDVHAQCPPGSENNIMHARLTKDGAILMASDAMPGMPFNKGSNFSVNIDCSTTEELDRYFRALGDGGNVGMEPQDTFWGARFGMLTDKYGVGWMFNCELPKQG
jgi:PhnB protein